jgi:hypothetical protein
VTAGVPLAVLTTRVTVAVGVEEEPDAMTVTE